MGNRGSVEVLVVGGGFTGIAAARSLAQAGVDVLLVDSFDDHEGGRGYSYDSPYGARLRFDHGAQYVGDLQSTVMAQIRDLLGPDDLVNGAELRLPYPWEVMVLDRKRLAFRADQSVFGVPGCPPQIGIRGALQMLALLAEMTIIERCIDTVQPWKGPNALLALDKVTVWDWVRSKKWVDPMVADLLRISVEAVLSVEPTEISMYYFLWYCACNDGFLTEINDGTGGPQQYWLRSGVSELAKRYAAPIRERMRRGVSVRSIALTDEGAEVALDGGEVIEAQKVVVATSPATAGRRIEFSPELPAERKALLSQPMGRTLKCQVYYKTDWWHYANGGKAYDGYVGGANYPVLWVMDNSPPEARKEGGPFVLMTFTVGDQLDKLGPNPTQEQIEHFVTGTLAVLFADERALSTSSEFLKLVLFSWDRSETAVGGGPNTVFLPGMLTGGPGKLLNEPWEDKVFFASAESCLNPSPRSKSGSWSLFAAEKLPQYDSEACLLPSPAPPFFSKYSDRRKGLGYLDGAMSSGTFVAQQVLASLGRPNSLPEAPSPAAMAPPEVATAAYSSSSEGLEQHLAALVAKIEALEPENLLTYGSSETGAGRRGQASWLRDAIAEVLSEAGELPADADPLTTLAAVRDFAVAVVTASPGHQPAAGPEGEIADEAASAASGVVEALRAADERIGTLFSSR